VLTIDNQVLGQRERDLRNGFTIPPQFEFSGLLDMAARALAAAYGARATPCDGELRTRR